MWELDSSRCWDNINTAAVGLRGGQTPWPQFRVGDVSISRIHLPTICMCLLWKQFGVAQLVKASEKAESALGFWGEKPLGVRTAGCQRWLLGRTRNRKQAKEFCWDLRPSNYSTSTNEIHANPQVNHCFLPSVQSRHSWFCTVGDLLPDEPPSLSHLLGETTLMSIFDHLFVLP